MHLNADSRSEITVELDIFSGRPNPSWTLGPAERTALLDLLRDVTAPAGPRSLPPGLGYRGLVVRMTSAGGSEVVRVGDGSIEIDGKYYRDPDRAIEKIILASMPKELKEQFDSILPKL